MCFTTLCEVLRQTAIKQFTTNEDFFAGAPNIISEQDKTTTMGTPCPTLCDKCVGSLTSPADHNREDAGDGTYGLLSLSEKTRMSKITICRCHHKGSTLIIRVINKIGRPRRSLICLITSVITDRIGRHKVLLPINH